MWQTPKVFQSSAHFLHPPTLPLLPTQIQDLPTSPSPSPLTLKQHCPFSRRELAIFTTSSLLLLGPQTLDPLHLSNAKAEENPSDTIENISAEENPPNTIEKPPDAIENISAEENPPDTIENISAEENPPNTIENVISEQEDNPTTTVPSPNCTDKTPTKRAFLDISINGEPIGRIVIGLYGNISPAGAARFADLVSGAAGISYRRKEFVKITPNYVQHGGLRSYGVDAELAKKTGSTLAVDSLKAEWERVNESCPPGTKNVEGSVSIMVRDPLKPPPKLKLVAKKGKLEIDEEEVGTDPNGTEFAIATRDSPELDASALVVGRVLEGMEVVQRIGQVKTVQENTSSPYFRVAKLIGDKRAVVAERGFNRPYSKVVVSNCGLLE